MHRLSFILSFLIVSYSSGQGFKYPNIPASPVKETIFGVEVVDTYRSMESTKDPVNKNWFSKQEKLTSAILDTLTEVAYFKKVTKEANNKTLSWANKVILDEKNRIYYTRQPEKEYTYKLFTTDKNGDNEILLYNPENYKPQKGTYKIDYLKPSWDGKYVAISLSEGGDFTSELFVLERKTGKVISDTLTQLAPSKFQGIHWLPDNTGFTYTYFPVIEKGKEGFKANSFARLHKIGTSQKNDSTIFGAAIGIPVASHLFPTTKISSSQSNYIFGYFSGATEFYDTYVTTIESVLKGKPDWKFLYGPEEMISGFSGEIMNNQYYYTSSKINENFGIYSVDINNPNFKSPTVVVTGDPRLVIDDFVPTKNGLYYTTTENGVSATLYFKKDTEVNKVEIPVKSGDIDIKSNININGDNILIEAEGWTTDLMRYSIDNGKISSQLIIAPIPLYPEYESLILKEIEIASHDGVKVPLSLIYGANRSNVGDLPTMLMAYGAFGNNSSPYFSPSRLTWVANGGMLAVAHVRGGGEKGQDWHDGGKKQTKENSWKDLIAVAEYLVEKNYTSKNKIALYGSSAGAITCGMAINERPDLFAVFLGNVPYLNPARSTSGSYKKSSYLEFGDIENPDEAPYLIKMDPYLNIKENTKYPAVMLSPSKKDNRLDLWQSGKYIARLQSVSTSTGPIILDVQANTGHTGSSSVRLSRLMGFAWWQINNGTTSFR